MQSLQLLNRKIVESPAQSLSSPNRTFSILQWNVLSSELGTPDSFPKVNTDHLLPTYRQPLIVQEIKSYSPDFVCLEEASTIDLEFFKSIDSTKYGCVYQEKFEGNDGLCFLYNQIKYDLIKSEKQSYIDLEKNKKQSQVFQLNIFKPKEQEGTHKDYLMIAFTHLKAKAPFASIRLSQLNQLVKSIEEAKTSLLEKEKGANLGVVVCGDFNDEPESEPLKSFKGALKSFKSAYEGEVYTTFKYRESAKEDGVKEMKLYKRVIDYVFYNENLELLGRSEIPEDAAVDPNGLPCAGYPSDHLSLFCKFSFTK